MTHYATNILLQNQFYRSLFFFLATEGIQSSMRIQSSLINLKACKEVEYVQVKQQLYMLKGEFPFLESSRI